MGYGHQLIEVEAPLVEHPEIKPFHAVIPNYQTLEQIAEPRNINIHPINPVNDYLPFSPIEYITGAFTRIMSGKAISGGLCNIPESVKFINKRIVNVPSTYMSELEFINVLQDNFFKLHHNHKFKPYILLTHTDILLNSVTSFNFSKTAYKLSIPLDVLRGLTEISLVCDFVSRDKDSLYFSLKFKHDVNGWYFSQITAANFLSYITPFELFMYSWELLLQDIDHLCNRKPIKHAGGFIDYNHHYNLRTKYDISEALKRIAMLIDFEVVRDDIPAKCVQTILADHNLALSSYQTDFKAALSVMKELGSTLEIKL